MLQVKSAFPCHTTETLSLRASSVPGQALTADRRCPACGTKWFTSVVDRRATWYGKATAQPVRELEAA